MPTATVPRLPLASLMGFAASFAIASLSSPATAMTPTLNARVALVADHAAVAPGQSFKAGLRIVHDKGWHTYWANPGDSGLPTRFDWILPAGASAGAIEWPLPERLFASGLTNFGYSDALLLPATLRVPAGAAAGSRFRATLRARWLICEEACIPDEATLTLDLPIEAAPRASVDAADFEATTARVPVPPHAPSGHSWRDATHVATQIDDADAMLRGATRIEVFPLTPQIVTSTRIEARLGPDGALRFRHPASEYFDRMPARIDWVIGAQGEDGRWRALQVSLPADDARTP
ncbi:protein-disulfide reductase DsbD domain-containing protein [Silanimonas sp.]|uniref:protein-disulfide reductase DsbD domain-containing protein n=1 Tax=Silanimonas sp. TaxID=1929290 RepID=UPI0022C569D1|nr:protein-disulfide reductase DsbD domain-containing protein [Silanimonas sp.]MCZ8062653.1 protein-disulfide reductase DsbD family protein [Silanimonas sp.]